MNLTQIRSRLNIHQRMKLSHALNLNFKFSPSAENFPTSFAFFLLSLFSALEFTIDSDEMMSSHRFTRRARMNNKEIHRTFFLLFLRRRYLIS